MRPASRGKLVVALAAFAAGCVSAPPAYAPQERRFVVTAVPLLTKELASTYPFLNQDFAPGGVLEGKEVYAFVPSTLTVVEGDTVRFTLVNPEDDEHNFVLPGLTIALPGQSVTEASWRAETPGIFSFVCTIPSHAPEMYGQIVVLPADVGARFRR
jgi:plastocyanin